MAVTTVGAALRSSPVRYTSRTYTPSIEVAGLCIVVLGAWGGIVPFVGPLFGFSGDGSASWRWNLAHALANLTPGAAAVFAGLLVMLAGRAAYRPGGLASGGLLAALCGAWFVIGPLSWPVLEHATFFVSASPLRELTYWIGYSLGPGVLLVALGSFVLGRPVPEPTVIAQPTPTPVPTAVPTPVPTAVPTAVPTPTPPLPWT
jgi:hypothetical protein